MTNPAQNAACKLPEAPSTKHGDEGPTIFPRTKALSVFNALHLSKRDMTRDQVVQFLIDIFDPSIDRAYVDAGVEFLTERGFVTETNSVLRSTRRGVELERTNFDRDLKWSDAE